MTTKRRYGGQTDGERQQDRRDRLIAAAIMLYGRQGYRSTGVRAVCQEAGLTERYFYESFVNSEALLAAAYEQVVSTLIEQIRNAGSLSGLPVADRARLRLSAYYAAIRAHPDAARVFLVEVTGVNPTIDLAFEQALYRLSELILDTYDPERVGPAALEPLLRRGIAGGLLHIALAWIKGCYDRSLDDVVASAMPLCSVAEPRPGAPLSLASFVDSEDSMA